MFNCFFIIIFFFINICQRKAYHWSPDGKTMYDLEYQGATFNTEANAWTASWLKGSAKTRECDGNTILGGDDILGGSSGQYWKRIYSPLPVHNTISVSLRFYPIDSWDYTSHDHFEFSFDGINVVAWRFEGYDSIYAPSNLCGNPGFKDLRPMMVYLQIPHSSTVQLDFRVISGLDQGTDDESLGFREVTMIFQQLPSPPTAITFCGVTYGNPLEYGWCPCDPGTYVNPPQSGNCAACDGTCTTCSGGGSNACTSCPPGRYQSGSSCPPCNSNCLTCSGTSTYCQTCPAGTFMVNNKCYPDCPSPPLTQSTTGGITYCTSICSIAGQYLWWDGTCGACSFSNAYGAYTALYTSTYNTFPTCNYPCPTAQFLHFNGTCLLSCPFPLTTTSHKGRNFCGYSCLSTQFLYWNGTCLNSCDWPLSPETQGSGSNARKFCWYYCQTSQFLYWNGSCMNDCIQPLTKETQSSGSDARKFCWYTCDATGQYLYWNGSCENTCPWPLSPETQGTLSPYPRQFCWYYCQTNEFLYWNGSCLSACPSPLSPETQGSGPDARNFCWYTCDANNQYLYWNGSCLNTCPWPLTPETQGDPGWLRKFCWYTCQPSQYLYWNGSCMNDCIIPLTKETQGTYEERNFCWYTCDASNQYLYWNGSCLNTCDWPLTPETQGDPGWLRKFCWYTCQPEQFLYWNGSCLDDCGWPLVPETPGTNLPRQFCWYLCQPNEFLYWNGSCLNQCPWPLSPEIQGTLSPYERQFCWYQCQPNQYLYWNGSCLDECISPLSPETQGILSPYERQFCWYLCQPDQYLYWNTSCLNECPEPLSPETQGYLSPYQRQFCWYTCRPDQYLLWNFTCIDSCPFPLSPETQGTNLPRHFCWYPCMPWQWLNFDQTCQPACNFPLIPETQGTLSPYERQFCWYPCTSESKFLYWNGTCLPTCPEQLSQSYHNGQWFCNYPCTGTRYLYWNGSCINDCVSPLTPMLEGNPSERFCYYLCPVNQFLYWDGTCQATCNFPLTPNTEGTPKRQFCWYLCPSSEFLYWNGTCLPDCPIPFAQRTANDRKFCDYSCSQTQFLAWNQTCLDTCPYPLKIRTEGTLYKMDFCDFPCDNSKYLYWNGSCLDTCDSPLSTRIEGTPIPNQRKFCDYPCVGQQYLYWNGSCLITCPLPLIIRIEAGRQYCDYLCPAGETMFWDGSCGLTSTCNAPLVSYSQGTPPRNYCRYPCLTNQFLYWNGSCINTCDFPLTSYISKGRIFCKYPCLTTQFLYYNGSCLDTCDLASHTENGYNYCNLPCSNSQYLYWNGSCLAECNYPLYKFTQDNIQYCGFPCQTTTDFLYWNQSCLSDCPTPFTQKTEGPKKFCVSLCSSHEYLHLDSSCSTSCDFPLVQTTLGSVKFCKSRCASTSEYLYWDGTCRSSCDFPLSSNTINGFNFCESPCSDDNLYLYWNGSCIPHCNSPLQFQIKDDKKFCDFPCSNTADFLYWDRTCSNTCDYPLVQKTEGSPIARKYCKTACDPSDFTYWNGSCFRTCPSPLTQRFDAVYKFCEPPCQDRTQYYNDELKACLSDCKRPSYVDHRKGFLECVPIKIASLLESEASFFSMFLYAPLEPNTVTFVKLIKTMQYVRYLDIDMPPRLARLGISKGRSVLSTSTSSQMNFNFRKNFIQQVLPTVYLKHELHSSFLVNYWEDLANIIIAIVLALGFLVFEKLFRALDWVIPEVICQTLRTIAKWNFVVMAFATNIDDIILFAALEFKSEKSNAVSLATAIVLIIFTFVSLIGLIWYIASKTQTKNLQVSEDFQVLTNGFKDNKNSLFNQLFYVLYIIRFALPMLIAVSIEIPLGNAIIQVIISAAVLAVFNFKNPFIKKINYYQILLFETITFLMNSSILLLVILSNLDKHNSRFAVLLGDFVILGNDIINVMCLAFLAMKLHFEIKLIRSFTKKHPIPKKEAIVLWVQLLYIPLQLSHFVFEEIKTYQIPSKTPPQETQIKLRKEKVTTPKRTRELQNEFDNAPFDEVKDTNLDISSGLESDRRHLVHREYNLSPYNMTATQNIQITEQFERLETFGEDNPQDLIDEARNLRKSVSQGSNSNGTPKIQNLKGILRKSSLASSDQMNNVNLSQEDSIDLRNHQGGALTQSFENDIRQFVSPNNTEDTIVQRKSSVPSNLTVNSRVKSSQEESTGSEEKSSESWGTVRRHFKVNRSRMNLSKDQGLLVVPEKKVDEEVVVSLWQGATKLFKPGHKSLKKK